jgi:hypothetical protein
VRVRNLMNRHFSRRRRSVRVVSQICLRCRWVQHQNQGDIIANPRLGLGRRTQEPKDGRANQKDRANYATFSGSYAHRVEKDATKAWPVPTNHANNGKTDSYSEPHRASLSLAGFPPLEPSGRGSRARCTPCRRGYQAGRLLAIARGYRAMSARYRATPATAVGDYRPWLLSNSGRGIKLSANILAGFSV